MHCFNRLRLTDKKGPNLLFYVTKHTRKWREHQRSVGWGFRALFRNCQSCVHDCDDLSCVFSHFKHMMFNIFSCMFLGKYRCLLLLIYIIRNLVFTEESIFSYGRLTIFPEHAILIGWVMIKKIMIDCRKLPGRMKRKILCNVKSIILMNRSTN